VLVGKDRALSPPPLSKPDRIFDNLQSTLIIIGAAQLESNVSLYLARGATQHDKTPHNITSLAVDMPAGLCFTPLSIRYVGM